MDVNELASSVLTGSTEQFSSASLTDKILVLRHLLRGSGYHVKLLALRLIQADTAAELLPEIRELACDWRPDIRAHSLESLRGLDPYEISDILREALRDPNRKVRMIAAELFHSLKRAA